MRLFVLLAAASTLYGQQAVRLTLAEAERLAVQNHPALSAAEFNAQASAEVPKELRSAEMPLLFGSITSAAASDGSRLAAGALNNPIIYDRFASGITISQLVTDFGRTKNLIGSAQARAQAQNENTRRTRSEILLAVGRTYFAVLRAQSILKVAEQTVAARQLVSDQVTVLAKNSLKSNLDVSFANVNLADAQLLLASARNNLQSALAEFATAIGSPIERNFTLSEETLPDAPPSDTVKLVADAIQHRPELAGLRYEENAAERLVKAERALMFPTVSGLASAGVVPTGASQLAGKYSAVGLNVNIPIFNGRPVRRPPG